MADLLEKSGAVEGRWGFHNCDRETFGELRAYHGLLREALRAYRAHEAWASKQPQNRFTQLRNPAGRVEVGRCRARQMRAQGLRVGESIPEPRLPEGSLLVAVEEGRWDATRKAWVKEVVPGRFTFAEYRKAGLYHHVLDQLRGARKPVPTPGEVTQLDLPEGWREQLARLRVHRGE